METNYIVISKSMLNDYGSQYGTEYLICPNNFNLGWYSLLNVIRKFLHNHHLSHLNLYSKLGYKIFFANKEDVDEIEYTRSSSVWDQTQTMYFKNIIRAI